jgi:hypothetical protein
MLGLSRKELDLGKTPSTLGRNETKIQNSSLKFAVLVLVGDLLLDLKIVF